MRDLRLQAHKASTERDEQVRKATAALEIVGAGRLRRADLQGRQSRVEELQAGVAKMKADNDARVSSAYVE